MLLVLIQLGQPLLNQFVMLYGLRDPCVVGRRFNGDGFLLDPSAWDEDLARKMAAGLDILATVEQANIQTRVELLSRQLTRILIAHGWDVLSPGSGHPIAGTENNGFVACTSEEWLAHRGTVGRALVGGHGDAERAGTWSWSEELGACRTARAIRWDDVSGGTGGGEGRRPGGGRLAASDARSRPTSARDGGPLDTTGPPLEQGPRSWSMRRCG